ncbi:MAG TPA: ATP-binding protein [Kofleriaceae bacterium]|nr:ATP-binding protein [Kofleriaceae bacterium]
MSTVGEVIERHREEILNQWSEGAGHGAVAEGLSPPELVSMMPDYLASLGQSGVDEPPQLSVAQQALIERHLSKRLRQGFPLSDIVTEFAILGRCVSRILDAEPAQERPAARDVAHLYSELYEAVTAVTRIFNEHMLEEQQREKRYTLLLQRIACQAMSAPDHSPAVRQFLGDSLTVIMAAMNAQSAAVLLFDATTNRLVGSAATGIAGDRLEQHLGSLDTSTRAGRVQPSVDGTRFVTDAETMVLEPGEELRRSGVLSLIGVRLVAGHVLRGVLCVGLASPRAFTPVEVRRIEDLGTSLTIHLENARLHATLTEKVQGTAREGELREQFVSVLMHDLNGPLEAAKANARKLIAPWTVDDPEQVAAKVVRDLERMEWMVNGLLDVHRIRTGQRLPLSLAECDLGAIAREAVEELRSSHGDRFVLQNDRGVRGVWSAEQLRRAIWNLAVNAIEHGADDRPVTVLVRNVPGGSEVTVHNEGPEIPPEVQAELFRPFSMPGSSSSGPGRGWGLGLTFVWGCVEAHGGQVVADSSAGAGTTFRVRLPPDARPYAE